MSVVEYLNGHSHAKEFSAKAPKKRKNSQPAFATLAKKRDLNRGRREVDLGQQAACVPAASSQLSQCEQQTCGGKVGSLVDRLITVGSMKVASESDVTCHVAKAGLLLETYLPHLYVGRGSPGHYGMQAVKGVGSPHALTVLSVSKTKFHFRI